MINDILDLTQITNGKLRLNPTDFSVVDVVKDVSKLIKFQAKRKKISFQFENRFPLEQQISLRSDPNRLKQIILNLLGNALKFTEYGFMRVIIEPAPASLVSFEGLQEGNAMEKENNNYNRASKGCSAVRFIVEDSGCGIKEHDIPKLFQLFGKLDNFDSQRINQTGIGLGLAISQNLVRCMNDNLPGAEITVTSNWGVGSQFLFDLYPMKSNNEQEGHKTLLVSDDVDVETDEGERIRDPLRFDCKKGVKSVDDRKVIPKKILLVDDDQINILVLGKYFSTFNDCIYDMAFNGQQALDMVKTRAEEKHFYDIIFMDCNMPVMDGFEATRRILDMVKNFEIPNVPIVASTANASPLDYENCFKNGMVDYISKPFGKNQLRAKIDSCFKKYKGKT
jgi:CheY-like chemotaxis protein